MQQVTCGESRESTGGSGEKAERDDVTEPWRNQGGYGIKERGVLYMIFTATVIFVYENT